MSDRRSEFTAFLSAVMSVLGRDVDALISPENVELGFSVNYFPSNRWLEIDGGAANQSISSFFMGLLPAASWNIVLSRRATTGGQITILCFESEGAVVEALVVDDDDVEFERVSLQLFPVPAGSSSKAVAEERRQSVAADEALWVAGAISSGLGDLLGSPQAAMRLVGSHFQADAREPAHG